MGSFLGGEGGFGIRGCAVESWIGGFFVFFPLGQWS